MFGLPQIHTESTLHPAKIGEWCTISRKCVIKPLFFESTITSEVHQDLIMQFIAFLDTSARDAVFRQDNVHPHVSTSTMVFFTIILWREADLCWLIASLQPCPEPLDFCVYGVLKDKIYKAAPATLEDLQQRISEEFSKFTPAIFSKNLRKFG